MRILLVIAIALTMFTGCKTTSSELPNSTSRQRTLNFNEREMMNQECASVGKRYEPQIGCVAHTMETCNAAQLFWLQFEDDDAKASCFSDFEQASQGCRQNFYTKRVFVDAGKPTCMYFWDAMDKCEAKGQFFSQDDGKCIDKCSGNQFLSIDRPGHGKFAVTCLSKENCEARYGKADTKDRYCKICTLAYNLRWNEQDATCESYTESTCNAAGLKWTGKFCRAQAPTE